ncbi:DNA-binding protein, partial [Salmonella enterica subsp. enterica serovar Paratyphi B]|nr:DNA-binding protein [Salmonella enterica subsp. enterica serovar Paratyphi B]
RIGPPDEPIVLDPGDYLTYPGDAAHIFEATKPGTSAVLISELR